MLGLVGRQLRLLEVHGEVESGGRESDGWSLGLLHSFFRHGPRGRNWTAMDGGVPDKYI